MSNMEGQTFGLQQNQGVYYDSIDQGLMDGFEPIYIFSIDLKPHVVSKGGLGEFVIPAREEGERVSKPLVIKGRHPQHIHTGTQFSPVGYIEGIALAQDIVGVVSQDPGLGRFTSNLEWHGVFITKNAEPTKKEIEAAHAKRKQYLERLVADADQKHMRGKVGEIDAEERGAAHELNLKKNWAEKPTAMDACPACGSAVQPGVAVCPHCNAVLDEAKAKKFFPERFAEPEPKAASKKSE